MMRIGIGWSQVLAARNLALTGVVAASVILAGCGAEDGDGDGNGETALAPTLGSDMDTPTTEQEIAQAALSGDGTLCGRQDLRQEVVSWIMGEDQLVRKYPDIARAQIHEVISDNEIPLPPATIEGVRPEIGLVICRFGRLSIAVQATADGSAVYFGPANDTDAVGLMAFRAALEREVQKQSEGANAIVRDVRRHINPASNRQFWNPDDEAFVIPDVNAVDGHAYYDKDGNEIIPE